MSEIVLDKTQLIIDANTGQLVQLTATVQPSNVTNKVAWKSSDYNVASVDQSGKVTANDSGTCTITCSATDGSGVKATCQVTVRNL